MVTSAKANAKEDIALVAHLFRRAGFGGTYQQLEACAAKGYEATVDEFLHPEQQADVDMDMVLRYFTETKAVSGPGDGAQEYWVYRILSTPRPLQEKVTLFWHGILCTGHAKCEDGNQILVQLEKFRRYGMGNFRDLLVHLASDPAMIFYLDNCLSHKQAINENWGRELLELFSMGVGKDGQLNYTEEDVKVCARAFTGWTLTNPMPNYPYGRYENYFLYNPQDHDDDEKTFLGEAGRFNGEDVIDIICKQPTTARFVARHLYNFFVADDAQVPGWKDTPPLDPEALRILEEEYFRSHYDIRSMLRVLFNSDFFKKARFARMKSPTEMVAETVRLVGDFSRPRPGISSVVQEIRYMGQDLMNPPTVEGWHTGQEWIDSGTLVERINFASEQVGNVGQPGVQAIIQRLNLEWLVLSVEQLLERCLEMMGCYELSADTRRQLIDHIRKGGEPGPGTEEFAQQVAQTLQLIVATKEYQFA